MSLTRGEKVAYYFDLYRVWPRAMLVALSLMTWHVTSWYMALPEPGMPHATFVSVVYGVIPLVLNFYMSNGVDWGRYRFNAPPATPTSSTATATVTQAP